MMHISLQCIVSLSRRLSAGCLKNGTLKKYYANFSPLLISSNGYHSNWISFTLNQECFGSTTMDRHYSGSRNICCPDNFRQYPRVAGRTDGKTKQEEEFILHNSEISRDHLTPEIALRLMTPSCQLWSAPSDQSFRVMEDCGIEDPFWAFYWPGGQVLTRYLLDFPSIVRGKCVLDVGSGCGASAIAAAMCGAKSVLANDIDRVAIQAINLNAALNNVTVSTTSENLIGCLDNQWDTVFLGDMFYDTDFTDTVTEWLKYLVYHDTEVLIGDPGRIFLQEHPIRERLMNVFRVDLPQTSRQENNGMTQGFVWKLLNSSSDKNSR